jgi:hypothetical protein
MFIGLEELVSGNRVLYDYMCRQIVTSLDTTITITSFRVCSLDLM